MNHFTVKIKPLNNIYLRHDIEDILQKHGYTVIGGGTDLVNNEMGISCEYPDIPKNIKPIILPKRTTDG